MLGESLKNIGHPCNGTETFATFLAANQPVTQDEINLLMVERAKALRQLNDAVSFMRLFCNSVVKDHKEAMLRLRGHALAWMDKEGLQRPWGEK